MNKLYLFAGILAALIIGSTWWLMQPDDSSSDAHIAVTVPTLSATAKQGESLFAGKCAACHGQNAAGSQQGPPLIHKLYHPGHHGDQAFQIAARNGVQAHHWQYGNMPPVDGATPSDVAKITQFVRELQKANGVF